MKEMKDKYSGRKKLGDEFYKENAPSPRRAGSEEIPLSWSESEDHVYSTILLLFPLTYNFHFLSGINIHNKEGRSLNEEFFCKKR
jgi:hypothetical protein